jgi:predicted MFS family arabinose efflux permease
VTQTETLAAPTVAPDALPDAVVGAMAIAAGLCVANIYYNQPLLALLAQEFGVSGARIGLVPMATQVGYALGLFFLAPLGDRFERKRLILLHVGGMVITLAASALARGVVSLAWASFATGVLASVVQQIVPMAAQLAPPARRGRVVGTVVSGILLGILLARTVSGAVAAAVGWRAMFWLAAGFMVLVGAGLAAALPRAPGRSSLGYGALLGSMLGLVRRHAVLRQASVVQALLFATFSVFWSTLALALAQPPFGLGSTAAGLFGLVGAAGALAAPLSGRIADRGGPALVATLGAALVTIAFLVLGLLPLSLASLIVAVIVMDLGVQSALVSNQARVQALDQHASSRLNTVYVTTMFVGGAIGSAAGLQAWEWGGERAVAGAGLAFGVMALGVSLVRKKALLF